MVFYVHLCLVLSKLCQLCKYMQYLFCLSGSLGIVASIVARLWAKQSGIGTPAGTRNSSLLINVQIGSGAHPASYSMGTRGSFPRSKVTGDYHLPTYSAEVKN
jgi:hypothetical protein